MTRALTLLLATLFLAAPALGADLDGTLKKIKAANTITLGYRDDARPFAFVGDDGKPAGYSVDLCTRIAADVAKQLALPNLQVKWVKVTLANRIESVVKGTVDLECGATTARPDSLTMSGTATPEALQISRMLKTTSRAYSSIE